MMKKSTLSAALALTLFGTLAHADVNSSVNPNPVIFNDGNWHTLQALPIIATAPRELVISYFAECSVSSNDATTWFQFRIYVDNVIVPPTNSDQALCTGIAPAGLDHWSSNGTTVAHTVAAGNHVVRVTGRLAGFTAGEQVRIDDQSLVVLEDD
jgi:hypothetical protein